jgi:hypothetical protein
MKLADYFQSATGEGVLATADDAERVDAAFHAKPHFHAEGTVSFVMRDRRTLHNLQFNPYAAYLFFEEGSAYEGIGLHLKKIRESRDAKLINSLLGKNHLPATEPAAEDKFLVYFAVERVYPLVAGGN